MKSRIIWLVVSVLMVLSLVLASCAPKVTEEKTVVTEEKKVVTEEKKVVTEEKKVVVTEEALLPYQKEEAPKYGGTLYLAISGETTVFPDSNGPQGSTATSQLGSFMLEDAVKYDQLRGPAGTGEWSYTWSPMPNMGLMAESWEIIQPDTIIFHIRKGVRFHDKPPVNGREVTPEDWLFSYRRVYEQPSVYYWPRTYGYLSDMKNPENSIYLDPDDPWALVLKARVGFLGTLWEGTADLIAIVPLEYKDMPEGMPKRWQDIVGTGSLILTDYVLGSSMTYVRNPNYYLKDALHPENQLPYIDVYKQMVMPDPSTRMVALRTGKIDQLDNLEWEDVGELFMTNPKLLSKSLATSGPAMHMRWDVKPFDDVRVRRAMMMAIDHPGMVRDYYGGKAIPYYWPAFPELPEHKASFVPLEEMPEVVQKMFGYYPEEAKRLLDEAGYPGPKRFTTSVTVSAAASDYLDLAELVAAYWAKVGVTLEIEVKESGVWRSMIATKSHKYGYFYAQSSQEPYKWVTSRSESLFNMAMVRHPLPDATYAAVQANYFDSAERARIVREATPELASLAVIQFLPMPYKYTLWQPWLKAYHGESGSDYIGGQGWVEYIWIDRDLKEAMTGRR